MATSLTTLRDELKLRIAYQETPAVFNDTQYMRFITNGFKRLYRDIGKEGSWGTEYNGNTYSLSVTLDLNQEEYGLVASEIYFYDEIKKSWDTVVSYSTDALSITGGLKPYENLKGIIEEKERVLSELFLKITGYNTMTAIEIEEQ